MWFLYALICMLLWGAADLFYKRGADEKDPYSHLKTSIAVGAVMGLHAVWTLLFGGVSYDSRNLLIYLPVSAMYILSMTIGYLGLRYLEVSVSSPVQNTSGALVCILCLTLLHQKMDALSGFGVAFVCVGLFLLGLLERRRESDLTAEDAAYRRGLKAFSLPLLYCLFDALGTFFDAWYLDDAAATPLLGVTEENLETVANLSYELTFLIAAILLFLWLRVVKKERLRIPEQKDRLCAAVLETAGQFAYVFAMAGNGVVAAPMIAAYSVVAVLLSRFFLKERLTRAQYAVVGLILAGILLLALAE